MAKRACLVTGCAGFVGSHLAERLLALGFEVVGVDNYFSGRPENMAAFAGGPGFTFYELDVADTAAMRGVLDRHPGVDAVFHLAAVVSVAWSVEHPDATMEVNYEATKRLYGLARERGGGVFVFAGSAAEYGQTGSGPIREEAATPATEQLSPYGRAKYLSTAMIEAGGFGVSLRCFNIFGPRQDPGSPYSGVISRFCLQTIACQPMTIFGDGGQTRDFIYVSDVVEAYLLAAGLSGKGMALSGAYNVGRGEETSVAELAALVARVAGCPLSFVHLPERRGDIRHSLADVGKLAGAAGFRARIPVVEGLGATFAWMRAQGG